VPFADGWTGRERLLRMAAPAIQECLTDVSVESMKKIPLLLCLSEKDRVGRLSDLDDSMLSEIEARLQVKFAPQSAVFAEGRVGGVKAIEMASQLMTGGISACVVAGVDSMLIGSSLGAYHEENRLKTEDNSNGFIPGEAAAAVLVGRQPNAAGPRVTGVGYGSEPASIRSEEPFRADGLKEAIVNALQDASATWVDIDYRITDANGEQYWFKEAALALTRTMRIRKETMDLWHPADCIGDIGAAFVPCILGIAFYAHHKHYGPGPGALCHFSSDGKERGVLVLQG
jgi:3-oxoacyl-[acyl-carrier-protein] synthase I